MTKVSQFNNEIIIFVLIILFIISLSIKCSSLTRWLFFLIFYFPVQNKVQTQKSTAWIKKGSICLHFVMHLNDSFTSLTHLNATILKGGKTKRQFALCSCSTYVNQLSTQSESAEVLRHHWAINLRPPKKTKSKVSLTSTQPTDMKVKQTQSTSILVFSISSSVPLVLYGRPHLHVPPFIPVGPP